MAISLASLTNPVSKLNKVIQLMDNGVGIDIWFMDFSQKIYVIVHKITCAKLADIGVSHQVISWV